MRFCRHVGVWLALSIASLSLAAEPLPRSMLILHPSDVRGPFYYEVFSALRSAIDLRPGSPVTIYLESLDVSRFTGSVYEESLQAHLSVKYRDRPIGVVVAVGPAALDYALRWRPTLWPGVPIVFTMVDPWTITRLKPGPGVTGYLLQLKLQDMMTSARAIVSDLKRVAIVGDRLGTQPTFLGFIDEIKSAAREVEIIDLTGLPMSELRKQVATLPDHTAILYTAVYSDGAGTYYPPSDAVALIAQTANRPIVVCFETFLGRGAIGGFVVIPSAVGKTTAQLALRVLEGEDASSIPFTTPDVIRPVFDWRELQRWGVSERNVPGGSEIRFRDPGVWERYRWTIVSAFIVLGLQTALIVGLVYERRGRRRAEIETRQRTSELAHMNRHAAAGELSASIAHELNQPLGAILNNTEAAIAILDSPSPNVAEIKQALADIKRDDQRASEIILQLRRMLRKSAPDSRDIDLNETVRDVLVLLSAEAASRNVSLHARLARQMLRARADPIQMQQVILNLIVNAIESIDDSASNQREVIIGTALVDEKWAAVFVADSGPGISPDHLTRVFEPLFTTKERGMGMGLSIALTIVEAHGGRIWAENQTGGGAVFHIKLPLAKAH